MTIPSDLVELHVLFVLRVQVLLSIYVIDVWRIIFLYVF